ncbi:PREDICTED: uncharacterized protein LOC107163188 [Diuraphis noxia]|uniref:uncharacterized protein LOC107163188 n=1 Tax=Diuraphis noxia TaxID=143948 RepID=UPI0007635933|nr:PREDICTED: uncharacterized protein LOC107163188 [Diuraphis noxia]
MSYNACDAKRHKTKKFSYKRKPIDVNQTRQVSNVQEPPKLHEDSKPKQARSQSPETKKTTPETRKPIPETRKLTPEIKKQISETRNYPEKNFKNQNDQTEIANNDNVKMSPGFENKATQTRICCIHKHCKRKQRRQNGNFIQDMWFCLTKLCK